MKIAIDLQGCQTPGSRQRGIGRYSLELARAIVRNRGSHRVHFLLNAGFPDDVEPLERALRDGSDVTFETYRLVGLSTGDGEARKKLQRVNDELLNWRYACAGADALHVSSLFEGWLAGDAHVSARIRDVPEVVRSATLYDVIPLVMQERYLTGSMRHDYLARLRVLHQLDVLFAISEASRLDAIERLSIPAEKVVNVGAATSGAFQKIGTPDASEVQALRTRHGLAERFVLYVGGIDHRKNIEFLMEAFAALPLAIRQTVQLVVVCEVDEGARRRLSELGAQLGIAQSLLLTGYVPDRELNLLYNLCELFVFPSLYEGFGLPLLEAMMCGACVIASNTSSMPEIVGDRDVLFDPADARALAEMMRALLESPERRAHLAASNLRRARQFSWDNVARAVLDGLEDAHRRRRLVSGTACAEPRQRVALVAPLPPQRTGVADYCSMMLPFWESQFDLSVVMQPGARQVDADLDRYATITVDELRQRRGDFETVLYHFGNSPYHAWMYRMLPRVPGVVVMHDFFLSGLVQWLDNVDGARDLLRRELAAGEGGAAALDFAALTRGELDASELTRRYPVSRSVIQHARGVIFHSRFAERLALETYADLADVPRCVLPHACALPAFDSGFRAGARAALGLRSEDILVCAFGYLVETKGNELLLEALADERLAGDARIQVAFVGELEPGPLQARIDAAIARHPLRARIRITGYVDDATYVRHLAACDIGVSVRSNSRGETSGAMLKQLAAGCATIVSDYAAMRELPDDVAMKVRAADANQLSAALKAFADNALLRERFANASRRWIEATCHPARVAEQYAVAVRLLQKLDRARSAGGLIRRIGTILDDEGLGRDVNLDVGAAISAGLALHPASARWLPLDG